MMKEYLFLGLTLVYIVGILIAYLKIAINARR
jgi:hypothetical protein